MSSAPSSITFTGTLPNGLRYTGDNRFRPEDRPDDQASRLRAMVDAMHPGRVPAPQPPPPTPRPAAAPQRHCPVVSITSGKGGVGKTSTCVNLAIALSQLRQRCTLLDADLGLANADVLCGMTPTTRLDAVVEQPRQDPLLYGVARPAPTRTLSHIAVDAPGGFRLVPGAVGLSRMANLPPAQREFILRGLSDLEAQSDAVLIDTGAGLSDTVTTFAAAADLTLVVATPEPTSIADAYAMIKCVAHLRAAKAPGTGFRTAIIINQANSREEGQAVHARIAATSKRFLNIEPPLLGVIHNDPAVPASVRARRPVLLHSPSSKASKDLRAVAASLAELLNLKTTQPAASPRRGLFGWFSRA